MSDKSFLFTVGGIRNVLLGVKNIFLQDVGCVTNEAAKVTQTNKQAAMAIEIFLGVIKKTLKKRDNIFISGFGTFSIVKRNARKGRNPKTNEAIKIAAKFTPKFRLLSPEADTPLIRL
jgi:DNA-binding protein HU-beta